MIQPNILIRQSRKQRWLIKEPLTASSGIGVHFIREFEQCKVSCQIGNALLVDTVISVDIVIGGKTLFAAAWIYNYTTEWKEVFSNKMLVNWAYPYR